MDAQDRTTGALNVEEAEAISNAEAKAAAGSASVLSGYRVCCMVSTVHCSADQFSTLGAAMKKLEFANHNPEIEITEAEYFETSWAS